MTQLENPADLILSIHHWDIQAISLQFKTWPSLVLQPVDSLKAPLHSLYPVKIFMIFHDNFCINDCTPQKIVKFSRGDPTFSPQLCNETVPYYHEMSHTVLLFKRMNMQWQTMLETLLILRIELQDQWK